MAPFRGGSPSTVPRHDLLKNGFTLQGFSVFPRARSGCSFMVLFDSLGTVWVQKWNFEGFY